MQAIFRYPLTQAHIDAGEAGSCTKCPIALALLEGDRSINAVKVDGECVEIEFKGIEVRTFQPTEDAVEFMEVFDSKDAVRPGTVILDYDKETLDYDETTA